MLEQGKVLIVEDEVHISQLLCLELKHANYICDVAYDGEDGLSKALQTDYDIILLDLMLPRMNGIELCRQLRLHKQTPVIMLTARDDVMDKVNGLQVGADDYLAKPFSIEELLARIQAVLRRVNQKVLILLHNDMELNIMKRKVFIANEEIYLTVTEFDLLYLLMKEATNIVTRDTILHEVWGIDTEIETNVVEVYIRYLRNKLPSIVIETVRGVGYRLT